jgi:hypothetical protein
MDLEVSDSDAKKGQHPHELFLFNLIFNHIFLFIATISAPSLQVLALIVPTISVLVFIYTMWMTWQGSATDSPYVQCHWKMAAKRSLMFFAMWTIAAILFGIIYLASGGHMKPPHYAIGGVAFLPIMLTVLALILMESEALQYARRRSLPKSCAEQCLKSSAQELNSI